MDIKDRRFLEKDLEANILEHISEFLLELGRGFSFVARQKRIDVDGDNFFMLDTMIMKLRNIVSILKRLQREY